MNQVMMSVLGKEQYLLGQLVQTRKLPEKTKSVFSAILSVTGAYPRYHPLLEDKDKHYVDMNSAAIRQLMSSSGTSILPFCIKHLFTMKLWCRVVSVMKLIQVRPW